MDPRAHLRAYVTKQGGIPKAAKVLGVPYQTLRSVVKGWRGVSQDQAEAWSIASGGELVAEKLVWIRATLPEKKVA